MPMHIARRQCKNFVAFTARRLIIAHWICRILLKSNFGTRAQPPCSSKGSQLHFRTLAQFRSQINISHSGNFWRVFAFCLLTCVHRMNGMHFEAWKCFCFSFFFFVKCNILFGLNHHWWMQLCARQWGARKIMFICCNICEWNPWSPWAQRDHNELIFGVTISVISHSLVSLFCPL